MTTLLAARQSSRLPIQLFAFTLYAFANVVLVQTLEVLFQGDWNIQPTLMGRVCPNGKLTLNGYGGFYATFVVLRLVGVAGLAAGSRYVTDDRWRSRLTELTLLAVAGDWLYVLLFTPAMLTGFPLDDYFFSSFPFLHVAYVVGVPVVWLFTASALVLTALAGQIGRLHLTDVVNRLPLYLLSFGLFVVLMESWVYLLHGKWNLPYRMGAMGL